MLLSNECTDDIKILLTILKFNESNVEEKSKKKLYYLKDWEFYGYMASVNCRAMVSMSHILHMASVRHLCI